MKVSIIPYLLPRLRDLFFVILFVTVLLIGSQMLNMDGDLPRHLLMGQLILETGSVPKTEPFVYPYYGNPYVTHEWLSTVVFALIYKYVGLTGIVITSALLIAGTFLIIFLLITRRNNNFILLLFITIWGAAATSLHWLTRPHLFSMFFLAVWLVLADRLERGEQVRVWWFPVLMLIWSNFHGEFIAGILVLIALAVGWVITYLFCPDRADKAIGKKIWLVLFLSVITSMITPAGFGSWETMLSFVGNSYMMSRMSEANPPNFQQKGFMILFELIVFSIFVLSIKKKPLSVGKALILAGFTAMSLHSARNVHLYGVVVPFVLAEPLSDFSDLRFIKGIDNILYQGEKQLKGGVWSVIITLMVILIVFVSGVGHTFYVFSPDFFPVKAVSWLEDHPLKGNMFNDLNWGGYIALHLWPEKLVFIDSMSDTTGEITSQYEKVLLLEDDWMNVLEEHQIQWVILPPSYPISSWLEQSQSWELIYGDDVAKIWKQQ